MQRSAGFKESMVRLDEILGTMDVPELRKNDNNWLLRNLGIRNSDHPDLREAIILIRGRMP